ncbi:MAG: hypothetical protein IKJ09_00725 [Bacteroidaceae bacterium]|nr:hypothetical protein [Bacteroidaceae bacterium]
MQDVRIDINKTNVYNEVSKTSAYIGSKLMHVDAGSYSRLFVTDEDYLMLERFWCEACNVVTDLLKPFIVDVNGTHAMSNSLQIGDNYIVTLLLPDNYDNTLTSSIENSLHNFFVSAIIGKWFRLAANKEESETYLTEAGKMLENVRRMLYHRRKPIRIRPTTN